MTREYIFHLNNDVYQVYATSQENAEDIFFKFCMLHTESGSTSNRLYWTELANVILNGEFIVTENFDFKGVKRIIN